MSCLTVAVFSVSLAWMPKNLPDPVPGYDWMAPKKRAPGKPAPPPVPAEKVVADFLDHVSNHGAYDADARAFVTQQRNRTEPDGLSEFINLAFSILSPDFKRGLDLLDEDNPTEAAGVFEVLSESEDPFLAVAAANFAATAMIEIEQIDRCHAMLDRVRKAHPPVEQYTTASDQFRFMLGYCQVHNLAYEQAYATFEDFLKNHPNAPERLRVSATQILTELSRRAPGRLGDVRDLLNYARRKIGLGFTDDDVLDRQDEAVELLDILIEEAEEQEQQGGGGGEGGGGKSGGDSGGQQPSGGAQRSTLPQGEGRIGELRKTRAKPGEMWGKMPPKEREQILQTLQKQFPSQYRELLEQYYKQLAKDAPVER
ncbi:MAG: hypothetical protein MI923_02285 [Phycisphaerales bacterium]|nr:hypothetical protein [Phycisphaerales bacterium]